MAIETVEAVRQAEQLALEKEKEAAKECDAILSKAQQDANEMVSSMTKVVLEKVKSDLEQAQIQGIATIEKAIQRANAEIVNLKEAVKAKEQSAIELVISIIA